MRSCVSFLLLGMALTASPLHARPARIVSLNPCIDAILVRLADPARIAAISHYSKEPGASSMGVAAARRFPAIGETAEEVVAMRPDLVLAGAHVAPSTVQALRRMGIALMQFDVPASIADSEAQISRIAAAVGAPVRGERLNRDIEAALARARPGDGRLVPALIWGGGGMVPGKGTLADELLRRTGFRNMSSAYGLAQWDVLPIEYLLARPPAVLLTGSQQGRRDRMLSHPAVRRLSRRIAVRSFAPRLLYCAGPTIIDAAARLAQVRRSLERRP